MGYLPLAESVLDALESWAQYLLPDQLQLLVMETLPLLDNYLKSSSKTSIYPNIILMIIQYSQIIWRFGIKIVQINLTIFQLSNPAMSFSLGFILKRQIEITAKFSDYTVPTCILYCDSIITEGNGEYVETAARSISSRGRRLPVKVLKLWMERMEVSHMIITWFDSTP